MNQSLSLKSSTNCGGNRVLVSNSPQIIGTASETTGGHPAPGVIRFPDILNRTRSIGKIRKLRRFGTTGMTGKACQPAVAGSPGNWLQEVGSMVIATRK